MGSRSEFLIGVERIESHPARGPRLRAPGSRKAIIVAALYRALQGVRYGVAICRSACRCALADPRRGRAGARPRAWRIDARGSARSTSRPRAARPRSRCSIARSRCCTPSSSARAIEGFAATLKADPSCAIAEWGIALSRWGNPFAAGIRPAAPLQQGRDAVDRAKAIGAKIRARARLHRRGRRSCTPASRRSINATRLRRLSRRDGERSRRPTRTTPKRRFSTRWRSPRPAPPTDKTYADLLKAGAILEQLIATPAGPSRTRALHHSQLRRAAARRPRARGGAALREDCARRRRTRCHMPSHTFTRVGYWQESIDANIASGEVAKREGSTAEELHTMDYRTYAYLQTGQDARGAADGRRAARSGGAVRSGRDRRRPRPARPASSRWRRFRRATRSSAAHGPRRRSCGRTPSRYPYTEALTYFARALGAARTGDAADDRERRSTR